MPRTGRAQYTLRDLLIAMAIAGVLLAWVVPAARTSTVWVAAFPVPAVFVILATFRRFTALQILVMVTATCATVALPLLKDVSGLYAKYAATLLLLGTVWVLYLRRRRRSRAVRE